MNAGGIRVATLEDVFAILDIYNISINSGISTGHTAPIKLLEVIEWLELMTPQRPFWVLEQDGTIVAWANADDFHGLPIFSNCAEIGVYVLPKAYRQGCAKALLEYLEIELKNQGTSHLVALIFSENQSSIDLFTKQEFQPWGVFPQAANVNGEKHDVHILGKIL